MIKVTVFQTGTRDLSGTSKTSGKPYAMRIQTAYAHTVDRDGNAPPVPEKIEVMLDKDQQPWPVGDYTLHPSSVYVDRNGRLAISARLAPLKARAPATT